jgi:hypothetical protein
MCKLNLIRFGLMLEYELTKYINFKIISFQLNFKLNS